MSRKNILQASFIFITFLLLGSTTIIAQSNIKKSPALESLLQQIDEYYIPPQWNTGMDEIAKSVPMVYCIFLGSAMRKQEHYLNQYPTSSKKFKTLNNEIISMMPQVAQACNDANSNDSEYEYIDAMMLGEIYYSALMGNIDEGFKQGYKNGSGKYITQVDIPFVLEQDEPSYIKEAKKDDAIILLGEKVLPESSPHELQGPSITGLKCPLKSDKNLKIDTNENPDDRTYLRCDYFEDGLLKEQIPYVNGYKHGEYFGYFLWDVEDIPYHLTEHGYYKNGNKNDIWDDYQYWPYLKKSLLHERFKYDNGVKVFDEEYKLTDSNQSVYLGSRSSYVKGKYSGCTWFYENRQKRMHSIYNASTSTSTKVGCWDENGNSMPCPGYW